MRGCDILRIASRRDQLFIGEEKAAKNVKKHIHVLVRQALEFRHAKGKVDEYLFTIFVESAARLPGRPYLLMRYVDTYSVPLIIRAASAPNNERPLSK